MQKGEVVMVYQDPVTEQKPEGKVELLKLISSDGQLDENWKLESWKVEFLDDGMITTRTIKVQL